MSKLRLVVLESDDADGNAIGAIVGVLREMQIGKLQTAGVTSASVETFEAPPAEVPELPRAKPARKPRAAKAAVSSDLGRGNNVMPTILTALAKNPRPDFNKLAQAIYGSASDGAVLKVKRSIWNLSHRKRVRDNKDGTYTVL